MDSRGVLTLKYRPQTLDELLVQEHVKRTLKRAIERKRFANAYLFAGPRGVGKTTTARILAKSLNCLQYDAPTVTPCNNCTACVEIAQSRSMDVIEIDGASNRGIEQVRELRENIKYTPSHLRFKVYIIDEVHMLTEHAFNALLKTLEEPPAHAKFVFATTAAHKVPSTIISRCQRFDFRKASPEEIAARLRDLAQKEEIKVADQALAAIARRAEGAIRDGESILEQLATYRPEGIELQDVEELVGLVPGELYFEYVNLLTRNDSAGLLHLVGQVFDRGYDLLEFYSGLVEHFRSLLLVASGASPDSLGLLPEERTRLHEQARRMTRGGLVRALDTLLRAEESAKYTRAPRVVLEYLSLELAALLGAAPDPGRSQTPATESAPDSVADQPPLDSAWQQLCSKVAARKPGLAGLLRTGSPESLQNDVLTVRFPPDQQAMVGRLRAESGFLAEVLSALTGRQSKVRFQPRQKNKSGDPYLERVVDVFGDVEEEKR